MASDIFAVSLLLLGMCHPWIIAGVCLIRLYLTVCQGHPYLGMGHFVYCCV